MVSEIEREFLQESNEIEGVWDAKSLDQAILAWEYLREQKILTPGVVLKTHKILMSNQPLPPHLRGYFRKVAVYVGGREGAEVELIPGMIANWCKDMNADPWTKAGPIAMHIIYEKIHPFVDGNGRTGRMFLNWHMLKHGKDILVIKAAERQKYYDWFG